MKNRLLFIFGLLLSHLAECQVKNIDHSERLINSTVRIESTFSGGNIGTGTGFYFDFEIDTLRRSFVPAIVTNKHVVNKAQTIKLFLKEKNLIGGPDYTKTYELVLNSPGTFIINHPDTAVDLCVIPIALLNDSLKRMNRTMYYDIFGSKAIPSREIKEKMLAIEEVYMIGYPNGLWDKIHNLPIVRRGVTATPATIDYNSNKEFVVDIAAFPGSSGSPVFLYNPNFYQTKKAIEMGGRIYLLGILYGGPLISMKGQVILRAPSPETITNIPMNLGYVLKSELLLGFLGPIRTLHYKLGGK